MAKSAACLVCSWLLLALSAVFCGLFGYTAYVLAKYTPVYRSISCLSHGSEMEGIHASFQGISTGGQAEKDCLNPNRYAMVLRQEEGEDVAGQVYVKEGDNLTPVGVSRIPEVHFAPGGRGNLTALLELNVGLGLAARLLIKNKFVAVAQFTVIAEAHFEYLGMVINIQQRQEQVCGFEIRMVPQQVGNTACAGSMDDLVIQDAGDSAVHEETLDMSPQVYVEQTARKNRIFGGGLAAYFVLAVLTGSLGACLLRKARAASAGAREVQARSPEGRAAQDPEAAEAPPAGGCEVELGNTTPAAGETSAAVDAQQHRPGATGGLIRTQMTW